MRSEYRCKAHNQGDRCRKDAGHVNLHDGAFAEWNDDFTKQKHPLAPGRNRQRDRLLRRVVAGERLVDTAGFLDAVIKEADNGR